LVDLKKGKGGLTCFIEGRSIKKINTIEQLVFHGKEKKRNQGRA